MEWLRERSLPVRVTLYVAAAILAFAVAASVGATTALFVQGDAAPPGEGATGSADEEEHGDRQEGRNAGHKEPSEQEETTGQEEPTEQEEVASGRDRAEYVNKVGDLQGNAVEITLDSHAKLLRYDRLTSEDLKELQANADTLLEVADQVDDLDPPQRYGQQYEVFRSAIDEMYEAAQIAHGLVADPTTATKAKFDEYDRLVDEADDRLRESNERLGKEYETIGEIQEISPL